MFTGTPSAEAHVITGKSGGINLFSEDHGGKMND